MKASLFLCALLGFLAFARAASPEGNPIYRFTYAQNLCHALSPRNAPVCLRTVPQLIQSQANLPGIAVLSCDLPPSIETRSAVIDCFNAANVFNLPLRQCNAHKTYDTRIHCLKGMFLVEQRKHSLSSRAERDYRPARPSVVGGDRRPKPTVEDAPAPSRSSGAAAN